MPEPRVLLGVIGRPHGVRGLVHVHSYTAEPTDLASYGPLLDEAGRTWTLAWRGEGVAALHDSEGRAVADRTAAQALTNTRLYVERERLPVTESDEFYLDGPGRACCGRLGRGGAGAGGDGARLRGGDVAGDYGRTGDDRAVHP